MYKLVYSLVALLLLATVCQGFAPTPRAFVSLPRVERAASVRLYMVDDNNKPEPKSPPTSGTYYDDEVSTRITE
jgi:hypothetical protein